MWYTVVDSLSATLKSTQEGGVKRIQNAYLQKCSHRLVCTSNLQLEKVCTVSGAVLWRTLGCTVRNNHQPPPIYKQASTPTQEPPLTGHAICICKFFLATKYILNFLLLHGCFLGPPAFQDILIRTCTAFESVDAQGELGGWIGTGYG